MNKIFNSIVFVSVIGVFLLPLFTISSCDVVCCEIPKASIKHNIMSYATFKTGMSIELSDTSCSNQDTIIFDVQLVYIDIVNNPHFYISGDEKWLFPGTPVDFIGYKYHSVSGSKITHLTTTQEYDSLASSFGDVVDKEVIAMGSHSLAYRLKPPLQGGLVALTNSLSRIELVCVNRAIAGVAAGNVLNSQTTFEAQQFHKVEGIGYTLNTLVNSDLPKYEVSLPLSDFDNKDGFSLLNVATMDVGNNVDLEGSYLPWRFTIRNANGETPFSGDYIFKLVFYFDDGALTIESNEFTVSVTEGD